MERVRLFLHQELFLESLHGAPLPKVRQASFCLWSIIQLAMRQLFEPSEESTQVSTPNLSCSKEYLPQNSISSTIAKQN